MTKTANNLSRITKYLITLSLVIIFSFCPQKTKAWWGPDGHTIVVKIAMQFLNPDAKQNVLNVLGNMSLDTAGNWMDIMRANTDYNFMKPWHYINISKEKQYQPSTDENIVNRLIIIFNELRHKNVLCKEQIKTDLLIIMHLMGDLHQPLHNGYVDDLGGNRVAVHYDTLKTNLHSFWDVDIIRLNKITFENCLSLYENNKNVDSIEGIQPVLWMKESRSLLEGIYDYPGFTITDEYLKKNNLIAKRQLLVAGLRLADMLNKLFISDFPEADMKEIASKYKNGIDAKEVNNYIGKKMTVCGRVYGIKMTDKVTFINVGDKFPNSPLTVVIFAKDRKNFPLPIDELFTDKNICIKGEIIDYKGKAEIIVTKPEDIIVH